MTGRHGGPGTLPPVPRPPSSFSRFSRFARFTRLSRFSQLSRFTRFRGFSRSRCFSRIPLPLSVLVFAAALWQVVTDGPLVAAEERLAPDLRRGAPPTALTELLADLGNLAVALPVLAAATAYAGLRGRRWRPPLAAVLVMACVPAVVVPLKALTGRPGPFGDEGGWFPSGHAVTAVVAYGAAAWLVLPYLRARLRRPLGAATALLCAAVGAGLVWCGYHWPLDVLAGWALGVVLLVVLLRAGGRRSPADPGG